MKASRLSSLLSAACLLLPVAVFAGNTTKKTLHLFETVSLEGKTLSPGEYRLEWSGTGPNVQLEVMQGRDTVATAPAKIVTASEKSEQDGYTLRPTRKGGQELLSVFFSGKDYSLQIQEPDRPASGASSSGTN